MKYITYTPTTGEIKTWGECDMPIPTVSTDLILEGVGTPATHYVSNGAIVAYTTAQATAKAARPSFSSAWSNTAFSWNDPRTLVDAQAQTWEDIKTARDTNLAAGFTWDGSKFDSDNLSIQRIQGGVQLATIAQALGQPFSINWTLFDNSVRVLSAIEMIQVGVALGEFVQDVFNAGVGLRQQIDAATSTTTLNSIKWVPIS